MADDGKVMNFISEKELDTLKATRGARVEDGAVFVDRPLYEILQEAKDKKDAEFNERFKNLPPKSLDEDETEFLESLDKQRKEIEKAVSEEEFRALTEFQTARAERTLHLEDFESLTQKEQTLSQKSQILSSSETSKKGSVTKRKDPPLSFPKVFSMKVQPKVQSKVQPKVQSKRPREDPKSNFSSATNVDNNVRKENEKGSIQKGLRESVENGEEIEKDGIEKGSKESREKIVQMGIEEKSKGEGLQGQFTGLVSYDSDEDEES